MRFTRCTAKLCRALIEKGYYGVTEARFAEPFAMLRR
jgi:hypothetical protein